VANDTLDLWPDDIKVEVQSPYAILMSQKSLLATKTKDILRADVSVTTTDSQTRLGFDLIAPSLENYRRTILYATSKKDDVYPVTVEADCFLPRSPTTLPEVLEKVSQRGLGAKSNPGRQAATQQEFIDLVGQVLRSAEVRSLIQSLIARSNEKGSGASNGPGGERAEPDGGGARTTPRRPIDRAKRAP
jgi:hypothetical protein